MPSSDPTQRGGSDQGYSISGTSNDINDGNCVEEGLASDNIPKGIIVVEDGLWVNINQTHFGLRSSSIKFFKYFGALKHS